MVRKKKAAKKKVAKKKVTKKSRRLDAELSEGTPRRDKMAIQGRRGLLILNGGGAIALLVFLQAVWKSAPELASWVVYAMIPLVIGAVFAVVMPFIRFFASLYWSTHGLKLHWAWVVSAACSFALFVLGMGIVIFGALQSIPAS
ncbi:MAG: hypothetical protein ACE1Z4_12180 [Gammaproteobacteria bacterium]